MSTNKPKGKRYKCPYCDYRGYRVELVEHVEDKHEDMIPKDYTPARVVYNAINKKDHGSCMICHKETKWDEDKQRYDTLCGSKKCKDEYVKIVRSRMVKKYGTHNLLTDPNFQKKMLENRSISGKYKFEDGGSVGYVGSYEKKFLEFMDQFLHIKSYDIISPGPTIPYKYKGKEHAWITDFIYEPYNLVFDIKDGGDNPNTREMKDYREKQTAKEKAIAEYGDYNYIRLTDNKFEQLISIFMELKEKADDKPLIRINESFLMEGTIITHSNNFDDVKKIVSSLSNKDRMQICNGAFKQSPYVKYRDVLIENGQPVSFIEVYELPQDKGVGYITIATVSSARKKGYSKLLVSKFLNSNEAKQFEVIAWKYHTGNDKSLNFAKSVGFDYEKDNTLYYEINESYLMEESNEYAEKYYEKMKQLSDEYGVEIYGRRSIDSDGSYYQKFLPTDNVMNEYNIESIISENTYVVSDLHFGKIKSEDNNTIRFLNKIPTTSTLLILGDIGYVKQPDLDYLRDCFSKIKCKNIFLVLGNHDCYGLEYYYSLCIKGIYEKILIKNKKWIFSHQPCDGPDIKWINFHGHIHEETVYKQVKDTKNKINCFYKNFDKPLKVKELIEWNKTSGIEKTILDESYINENYLISQDDIKFNFDLWKKNSDHNILFVTGLSGSGKSTLARKIAKEHKAEYVEFDMFTLVLVKGLDSWNSKVNDGSIEVHPLILEYVSQTKFTQPATNSWAKLSDNYNINEHNKFVKWFIQRVSGDGKLYVLEGAQFFMNTSEESNLLIAGEPLIVTGTSMMKSWVRRYNRDVGDDKNLKTYMKYLKKDIPVLFKYYFDNEKNLQDFTANMSQYYTENTTGVFDVEIV